MLAVISWADLGDSVRVAFFMFWETVVAALSGAVQTFVLHEQMQRAMGDHGPDRYVERVSD